jgi:hypothetical protein
MVRKQKLWFPCHLYLAHAKPDEAKQKQQSSAGKGSFPGKIRLLASQNIMKMRQIHMFLM